MLILSAADMISLLTFVKRAAADEKTVRLIGCCRRSARQSSLAPSVAPQTLASYGPSPALADNARAISLFNTCTISRLVSSGAGRSTVGVGYLTAAPATEEYVVRLFIVVAVGVVVVISDTDWVSRCLPLPFFLSLSASVCSCLSTSVWLPLCVSVFLFVSAFSGLPASLSVSALSAPISLIPSISVYLP